MYRAFKLDCFEWCDKYQNKGGGFYNLNSKKIRNNIVKFFDNGKINGSDLRDDWFPDVEASVFISHSHRDIAFAKSLAAWLYTRFGITSFVDSFVWGYSLDLQKRLDNKYCLNDDKKHYDYQSRNVTTSHVNMMLATALSRMLDKCECAIFVSSPNSVKHTKNSDPMLESPWIFYELSQLEIIRKEKPDRTEQLKEARDYKFSRKGADIPIHYRADFSSLTKINALALEEWSLRWNESNRMWPSPLDALYELNPHQ